MANDVHVYIPSDHLGKSFRRAIDALICLSKLLAESEGGANDVQGQ